MENKNAIAMDLIAKMAIMQLSKETNESTDSILISFMKSNAGKMLYDDSTKLWWDGPFAVAEEYKQEKSETAENQKTTTVKPAQCAENSVQSVQ